MRLKFALDLAVLESRACVLPEDWQLATTLKDNSNRVRDHVLATVRAEASEREEQTRERYAKRVVHANRADEERPVVEPATRIRKAALKEPGVLVSELRRRMRAWPVDEGVDHAIGEGWVEERRTPSHTGDERRAIYPRAADQ